MHHINPQPIEKAIEVLSDRLSEIDTVKSWSGKMGFRDPKIFSMKFRAHFRKRPKKLMATLKKERAIKLLREEPEMSCFEIALKIGKSDEHALYHFLKKCTGLSPRQIRNNTNKNIQ